MGKREEEVEGVCFKSKKSRDLFNYDPPECGSLMIVLSAARWPIKMEKPRESRFRVNEFCRMKICDCFEMQRFFNGGAI